jgi:murein DD-endopeptidase MepM/ murein hydrolase activator NlpD
MSFRVHHSIADDLSDLADEGRHQGHGRRRIHTETHHDHRGSNERHHSEADAARERRGPRGHGGPTPFTLGHAGHQVRIGPVAFWTVVGTLVIMAGWSVATATYFAFQDDVLSRVMRHQADMQFAYEDRLAEMRAQVDRVTSRQLLDQDQIEQKLDQIVRRQSVLEQRATAIGAITDPAATGSARSTPRPQPAAGATPKPSPISWPGLFAAPAMRDAKLDTASPAGSNRVARPRIGNMQTVVARLIDSLDRVEGRQTNTLAAVEESYEAKARRMRTVLADVGLDPAKAAEAAIGGPFVPYRPAANSGAFEKQIYRINVARAQVERMTAVIGTVPLRKPVEGEIDTSSNFGVRIDPFVGRPAMHTGLDFRGETGEEIRVTASGTVVSAGWSGGYGRMVEVDHGNGFATRYGHLSQIDVHVGQTLRAGSVVGRMGSTGRSTGPHLHYETRISGEAVDPQRFLHAGAKFGLM